MLAECHKILLGPKPQEPKYHYCKRYVGVKIPLVQVEFSCSNTRLVNMYPLILTSKQASKQYTKGKHKPSDSVGLSSPHFCYKNAPTSDCI